MTMTVKFYLRNDWAVNESPIRSDVVELLADPGDHREVLGEVGGEDPRDPVGVQILQLCTVYTLSQCFKIILELKIYIYTLWCNQIGTVIQQTLFINL